MQMSMETEIKILNVSIDDVERTLKEMGAIFVGKNLQKIYTYDLPTIAHRYQEILFKLNHSKGVLEMTSYKQRLKTLLVEVEDLLLEEDVQPILSKYAVESLQDIVNKINDVKELEFLAVTPKILNMGVNPNKWIRLRRTGDKTTLTVKHVFEKNNSKVQKVGEFEIRVDDVDATDALLSALGFAKRNVQEKERIQYKYKDAEIDIDHWPLLDPYMEIEFDNENTCREILNKCGYSWDDVVSCNTEDLYRNKGMNIKEIPELLFK